MEDNNIEYVGLAGLRSFLGKLKETFANKTELDTLGMELEEKTAPAGEATFGTVMSTPDGSVKIENGIIEVQNNLHNHIIENITGLDEALSSKAELGHNHDEMYYTEPEMDEKLSEVNSSIEGIIDGITEVGKAKKATNAEIAEHANSADSAEQDGENNIIAETYETKSDANSKLEQAKSYADERAISIKNDLLNGAGDAYDTLKELADLIDDNTDAIDALEIVAAGKADKVHTHDISDVTSLQDVLDGKVEKSDYNTHVNEFNAYKEEFNTHVDNFDSHTSNKDNPHEVTASQIGAMKISTYDSTGEVNEAGGIVEWANSQYEKKVDGVIASSLAIGSSVFLNVDGVPTEFIVVHQGNPDTSLYDVSCNGTWLLMKDSYVQYMPFDTDENNIYSSSDIHSYLNSDFYNLLDNNTKSIVKQVKIPYVSDSTTGTVSNKSDGLSAKVFILGAVEIGHDNEDVLIDGATLSYFEGATNDLRIAKYKGENSHWWTRTSVEKSTAYNHHIVAVFGDGNFSYAAYGASDDIRPAFIISSSSIINPETGEIKIVYGDMNSNDYDPTGEIISAGGIIEWFNANGGSSGGGGNAGGGISGQLASDLKIGSSVFFNVDGVETEFIVVHQGNPDATLYDESCNGTWFMAKDIYAQKAMSTVYTSSDVHDYLSGTFFNLLDEELRVNIKQVKLPYTEWTTVHTGADGAPTRVFIPSRNEINFGNIYDSVVDGAILSYFEGATNSFRLAYYNGAASAWWTRTAYTQSLGNAHCVLSSGSWGGDAVGTAFGVRPMFILPSDYSFASLDDSTDGSIEEVPFNGKLISSLEVGKSVSFNVGGKTTEFIVVQQGNPDSSIYDASCDGTWFMAKDIYTESAYNSISTNAASGCYDESDVHNYLSGDFLELLDENLRLNIVQAKIPYVSENGTLQQYYGEDGLLVKAFILDAQEMGLDTSSSFHSDYRGKGAVIDYFNGATDSTRIANYNGAASTYWTRGYSTTDSTSDPKVYRIWETGVFGLSSVSSVHGVRPVFILPSDMYIDVDTGLVQDAQDYVGGNGSSVLPQYTSEDEGKILCIVNGVPAWVDISTL